MVVDGIFYNLDQFVLDTKEDIRSPTTSSFSSKLGFYRQQIQSLSENLDFDLDGLHKLKKSVKYLYEAGQQWHSCEQDLVVALDQIAGLNAANSLIQDSEPEISAAWLKFCVIFKDLSVLTRSLVQSVKNNLIFPVDNLLKSPDIKDKYELKKGVEKAFKDYDAKLAKCEKVHKNSPNLSHISMGNVDIAENLLAERTILQYELCKFYLQAGKIRGKKGTELLQHLIDFYHTQESFYREGLRTVEEFRCYVSQLIDKLNEVKRKQENERKQLRDLAETLEKSPFIRDYNPPEKISDAGQPTAVPKAIVYSMEPCVSSVLGGYLLKKSSNKMHKSWLRRKCEVRNGIFYMWHSDESAPPVKINLLTCQIKSDKHDKKCFHVVSYERTYHFQADDEQQAANWLFTLSKNRDTLQNEAFREGHVVGNNTVTLAIQRIKSLPGNDVCCDCGSDKDVDWLCVNLGSLHCIDCSGCHRELGVHVSRIQSLNLDHADMATLLIPLATGNKIVNEIYEATMDDFPKKTFTIKNNVRKSFIATKYVDKKFTTRLNPEDVQKLFAESVDVGSVKTLLQCFASGVDLNTIFDEDVFENALFTAVRNDENGSHLPYIHFLIQNGIDVNRVNITGDTALHVAVRLNKIDCVRLILLGRNLRLSLANGSEETAKHLARKMNAADIENLIVKFEQNDKSTLGDVCVPESLLPLVVNIKVEYDAMSLSNDSSPRGLLTQQPPPPPPSSAKPMLSSLVDDRDDSLIDGSSHRRSASDSTVVSDHSPKGTQSSPLKKRLPGAKLVLPPNIVTSAVEKARNLPPTKQHADQSTRLKQLNSSASSSADMSSSENLSPTSQQPPKPVPRRRKATDSKPLLKRCRALYDCAADNKDELSFKKGDIILVTKDRLREEDDNWLEGYVESKPELVGLFPVTFVTFEK